MRITIKMGERSVEEIKGSLVTKTMSTLLARNLVIMYSKQVIENDIYILLGVFF